MHSVLFAATIPEDPQHANRWEGFVGYANNKLPPYKNVERLAENVWLVNIQISPAPLGFLVAGAEENRVAYKILSFDAEPQWLPVSSGPMPIPAHSG
jgi:hypothetical protein